MTTAGPDPVPEPELTRLRLVVMRLARRMRQDHAADLTPSQLSAMSCIERAGPLSLRDLAEMERVQPPSISRVVGALEGEGWVERIADPADRRVVLVSVTEKAHRELERIRVQRNAWLGERLDALAADERATVLDAVESLEALLGDVEEVQ